MQAQQCNSIDLADWRQAAHRFLGIESDPGRKLIQQEERVFA
jgi:hypothetical protein